MAAEALKRKLYDNCLVRNTDGEMMFYCATKRANWYLDRNLAIKLNDDPLEVQLTFEPKGKGHLGDDFYLQPKKNICIVCGTSENLTRHHIVPMAFRRYMDLSVKNHDCYDVVLLCVECHERYEVEAHKLKTILAKEYDAPVHGVYMNKDAFVAAERVNKDARTLLKHSDKIPAERKEFLLNRIKTSLGRDDIDLAAIAGMSVIPDVRTQGEIIVAALNNHVRADSTLTNLDGFLYRWRRHFIDSMKPKYITDGWQIDRPARKD